MRPFFLFKKKKKKKKYIYIYRYTYTYTYIEALLTVIVCIALLEKFHLLFFAGCNQPWNSAQYVEAERNKYFKRKKGNRLVGKM